MKLIGLKTYLFNFRKCTIIVNCDTNSIKAFDAENTLRLDNTYRDEPTFGDLAKAVGHCILSGLVEPDEVNP